MTLLIEVLKQPTDIENFSDKQWDTLTCEARSSGLLGRLFYLFSQADLLKSIPSYVLWHYEAAGQISDRLKKNALREIDELGKALNKQNIKTTFLKGAAYQVSGASCNFGRFMSDIDILVDKAHLGRAQGLLLQFGWLSAPMDDYDQHYYRQWMHEIPPLRHIERQTTLDVHHNILPLTNKNAPLASQLATRQVNHQWCGNVNVLTPTDTVIHSAVHLFTESEFHHALRDLSDLHLLISEYSSSEPSFVKDLIIRANDLGLSRYIWLALTFTQQVFETEFDETLINGLNDKPASKLHKALLCFSYSHVFLPNSKDYRTWKVAIAEELLFWRSHLIKMPLYILVPHLVKKSYKRLKDNFQKDPKAQSLP